MVRETFTFAILLVLLGGISYFATGQESVTALIPAFFGVIFLVLAQVMRDEAKAKHAGHAAAVLSLLGLLGSARGVPGFLTLVQGGEVARPAAVVAQSLMALGCLVFLILGIKSFRDARKAREAAEA